MGHGLCALNVFLFLFCFFPSHSLFWLSFFLYIDAQHKEERFFFFFQHHAYLNNIFNEACNLINGVKVILKLRRQKVEGLFNKKKKPREHEKVDDYNCKGGFKPEMR